MADLLNLTKAESDNLLNLRKEKIQTLCLEKPTLLNSKARVALCLDYSGSMRKLYKDGTVQAIIERILPIAMQFDDDGEMELWLFDNSFRHLEPINLKNYYGYVEKNILANKWHMGGTEYAPVINDIKKMYVEKNPAQISNYIIFITDGDNSDKPATTSTIKDISKYPIFFEFIGIGHDKFAYLEKLDDLDGRYVDNADFFSVKDVNKMSDDEIYKKLLTEFPSWLEESKVQEMITKQSTKKGFFSKLFK